MSHNIFECNKNKNVAYQKYVGGDKVLRFQRLRGFRQAAICIHWQERLL